VGSAYDLIVIGRFLD